MLIPPTSPDTSQTQEAANSRATPAAATGKPIIPDSHSAKTGAAVAADTFTSSATAPEPSVPSIDKVNLSAGSSAARSEKIEAIRARIAAGTYQISNSDVAAAMMRKGMFNTKVQ